MSADSEPRSVALPPPATAVAAPHEAAPTRRQAGRRFLAGHAAWAAAGILLFALSLETITAGAGDVAPLLRDLRVAGPANALGFGWLFSYVTLSGSPVAAVGISLLSAGTMDSYEAFAVVGGSRLGASFIVLAVGFLAYLRGSRSADGLSIGVIALLTTFTTQGPALLVGLGLLRAGWLDGVSFATPAGLVGALDAVYGPVVDLADALLPGALLFVAGVGGLLAAFWLFDRALPQLQDEAEGIARVLAFLRRRPLMFLMGCAVTLTTMSVALSITVLVPLALKGYVRRDHVIPYVMGANITTFADTLFASVLLGGSAAFTVVLVEIVSVALVSGLILVFAYGPYARAVLAAARWATAGPRHLALFLAAIVGLPALLMLI